MISREWINPDYLDQIVDGSIRSRLVTEAPYPVAVLTKFLIPAAYDEVESRCQPIITRSSDHNIGAARSVNIEWGPLDDLDTLRCFYGSEVRKMMMILFGREFTMRKNSLPHLAQIRAGGQGFSCHNDRDEPRDAVALFYMTPQLPPDGGGALLIHDRQHQVVSRIPPRKNTLVLFEVSDHSWHSTQAMYGDWVRRNLLFDWERTP